MNNIQLDIIVFVVVVVFFNNEFIYHLYKIQTRLDSQRKAVSPDSAVCEKLGLANTLLTYISLYLSLGKLSLPICNEEPSVEPSVLLLHLQNHLKFIGYLISYQYTSSKHIINAVGKKLSMTHQYIIFNVKLHS